MKKILPVAVLAAMAGVNGAQAVHVNGDGLGQVLLFPYYTTTGGQDTYINLVNTTDRAKAVKVRILESLNSKEVLDFNLYLSPYDHWSAAIYADPDGEGAVIQTADNSCTVPKSLSDGNVIPFRDFEYADGGRINGINRTSEGHIEVIEMGDVYNDSEDWFDYILHGSNGFPGPVEENNGEFESIGCREIERSWFSTGVWFNDRRDGISFPTGGLYGYGVLIDVEEGVASAYDAVAIDDFVDTVFTSPGDLHTNPGDTFPNFNDGSTDYDVIVDNGVISGTAADGYDAVSAVLMHDTISNDYVLEEDIEGGTDWIITFPTKREYVDVAPAAARAPFSDTWDTVEDESCEPFSIRYWNREELDPDTPPGTPDFSPSRPNNPVDPVLCAEANVLTFNQSNVLEAFIADPDEARNGANLDLEEGFENGWARIDFVNSVTLARNPLVAGVNTFEGLPVIGVAVQKYVNGTIEVDGETVLSNYAVSVQHKGTRSTYVTP